MVSCDGLEQETPAASSLDNETPASSQLEASVSGSLPRGCAAKWIVYPEAVIGASGDWKREEWLFTGRSQHGLQAMASLLSSHSGDDSEEPVLSGNQSMFCTP